MKLLDLKDAAARLGVDYATALQYVHRGMLPAVRLPSLEHDGPRRKIQVREADLEAFAAPNIGAEVGTNDDQKPQEMAPNHRPQRHRTKPQSGWYEYFRAK